MHINEMSIEHLTMFVRKHMHELEHDVSAIQKTVDAFKGAGIKANIHVGSANLDKRQAIEWYAGQVVDVLETGALYAVNSLLNCLDRFVPRI